MTTSFALLGNTTLGSPATSLTLSGLATKKYLIVEIYCTGFASGNNNLLLRFNNDSGANYADRLSQNGGADSTDVSQTSFFLSETNGLTPRYVRLFIVNTLANEKLIIGHTIDQNTAGAGNAPARDEFVSKWANTSVQINELDLLSNNSNMSTGTIITVYGSD